MSQGSHKKTVIPEHKWKPFLESIQFAKPASMTEWLTINDKAGRGVGGKREGGQ